MYFKYGYEPEYHEEITWNPPGKEKDNLYGYRLPANNVINHQHRIDNKLIYDVNYTTDAFHRRQTPQSANWDTTADRFIAITGGSFAFGYGVEDTQTLAFHLDSLIPRSKAYNYAVPGYGTQHLYLACKHENLKAQLNEKQGTLIYYFIDHHVNRTIGSRRVMKLWGKEFPYLFLDKNNRVVHSGNFLTGRPLLSKFYLTITQSAIVDLLDLEIPLRLGNGHFRLVAKTLEAAQMEFYRQFPDSRFLVVLAPGSMYSHELGKQLELLKIETVDLSNLLDPDDEIYRLHSNDPHPNVKYYKKVAGAIHENLNIIQSR